MPGSSTARTGSQKSFARRSWTAAEQPHAFVRLGVLCYDSRCLIFRLATSVRERRVQKRWNPGLSERLRCGARMDRPTQPRPVPCAERDEVGTPGCRLIENRCLQISEPDDALDGEVAQTPGDDVQVS